MQGNVIIRDAKGNKIAEATASHFPLDVEIETFIGEQKFVVRYSYLEDSEKKGWKDRSKIKGLVMMRK